MSAAALRHSLFLYCSDDEYASRIAPFLAEGVDEGDAVCVVVTARHRMLLEDGLVAVDELLANARRHARGVGELRAGQVGERVVIELSAHGPGHDDPLAGYLPPRRDGLGGAGLWVARQLSADLELLSSPGGLVARLWI
jgi:hypothetical protein